MSLNVRWDRCCNPLNKKSHLKRIGLRHVPETIIQKFPRLTTKHLICDSCRKTAAESELLNLEDAGPSQSSNLITYSSVTTYCSQGSDISVDTKLPVINQALTLMGNSPILSHELGNASTNRNLAQKVEKIKRNLKNDLGVRYTEVDEMANDYTTMLANLKAKFHAPHTPYSTKVELLTLLPDYWSICKMAEAMKSSYHLAKVDKNIAANYGILSKPEKKIGKPISVETKNLVTQFYETDDISSTMPGKKDYISIKNDQGVRTHYQKRLVLGNLREIYHRFKIAYPNVSIGFSSFAKLRPGYCILAGASGTHTVCVCSIHQNLKLMMEAARISSLTSDHDHPLVMYEDVLMLLICRDFGPDCYLGYCKKCPQANNLHGILLNLLMENDISTITYKHWVSKPRCTLETMNCTTEEFVENFCDQAKHLLPHSFVAKQQSSYLRHAKDNLKADECIIICDFAENYAFVVQHASPGFHWNNNQATVYPVVVYYKPNDVLLHKSLCIISDCLQHDAVSVYAFSRIINNFVKSFITHPSRIIYFSDGAPQQYKNYKNFVNIYYHEQDFGVPAEWHFFATAHGKGPCDGVGGTLKRLAARASLQLPADKQILTPTHLYEWACRSDNMSHVAIEYWDTIKYQDVNDFLTERFRNARSIPQTLLTHCISPTRGAKITTKRYSFSEKSNTFPLMKK